MYAEIQAAIESAKTLADIIKMSKELRESADLAAAVSEINAKLLHVGGVALAGQEKQAYLTARVQELEAEIVNLKDWSAEKAQYTLVEFSTGMFTRIHNDNKEPLKSAHKFCSACFDNGKKTLLQMQANENRKRGLFCPACKTTLWLYHGSFSDEQRG